MRHIIYAIHFRFEITLCNYFYAIIAIYNRNIRPTKPLLEIFWSSEMIGNFTIFNFWFQVSNNQEPFGPW